jgi:hypothetical protein
LITYLNLPLTYETYSHMILGKGIGTKETLCLYKFNVELIWETRFEAVVMMSQPVKMITEM